MCTSDEKKGEAESGKGTPPYSRWNPDTGSGDGLKMYGLRSGWDEVDCGEHALSTGYDEYDELEGNRVEGSLQLLQITRTP